MSKIDELHNYAYPDKYLDELHIYDKSNANNTNGFDEVHNYGNRGVTYGMDELHLYGSYQTVEIDELNTPQDRTYEVIDIDEWFDEMELDEEQKEERKELAIDIKFVLALLLLLLQADMKAGNSVDEDFYVSLGVERIMDAVNKKMPEVTQTIIGKIRAYVNTEIGLIVDSTVRNYEQPYTFSEARAVSIAVDDANALFNIKELDEAIKAGFKYKTWITMRDNKVRHSHEIADGQTVGIKDAFTVGRCKMTVPRVFDKETSYRDPKEVVNCRCVCNYTKQK